MKAELQRRAGITTHLITYFQAWPYQWILATELGRRFGQAVRSRLTEARRRIKSEGHVIEWNHQQGAASAYRFLPYEPIGRSAETYREQSLF